MQTLPKLKVKKEARDPKVDIIEFEQARFFPFDLELIISVEGQQVTSYQDLLKLAMDQENQGKEFLDVMFLPMIGGG